MFRYAKTWIWGVFPLSALLAAAVYALNLAALPSPVTADRDGLVRWLVFAEIRDREESVQLALLDRLQEVFSTDGEAMTVENTGLSESLQQRLERNMLFLQELWFYTRCEQACALGAAARPEFLDRQIYFAERWGDLTPSNDGPDVFDLIDDWIAAVEGEKKRKAQDGVRWALHRFLQTRDLAEYPESMRLELANRIVEDLEYGSRLDAYDSNASSEAAEDKEPDEGRLEKNGLLLIKTWLTDQARQYSRMSVTAQSAYLAKRLQQIQDWNVVAMFGGSDEANRLEALAKFASTTQKWVDEASDENRPAMQKLFRDIAQRLLFGPS